MATAVLGGVLQVLRDQRARRRLVQAVRHRAVAAGDDAAEQGGVVLDVDLVAAVAGPQARMFRDGLEVAVHLAGAGIGGHAARTHAIRRYAKAQPEAHALVLGVVLAAVLQALK